jgi:hypothetical protein
MTTTASHESIESETKLATVLESFGSLSAITGTQPMRSIMRIAYSVGPKLFLL